MQMAKADPDRFVLKPQLEGGGKLINLLLFSYKPSQKSHVEKRIPNFILESTARLHIKVLHESFDLNDHTSEVDLLSPSMSVASYAGAVWERNA